MFVHMFQISCYIVECNLVSSVGQIPKFLQARPYSGFFCYNFLLSVCAYKASGPRKITLRTLGWKPMVFICLRFFSSPTKKF